MKLHNYFRSSASFRVRIALALKGLPYQYIAVNLAQGDHLLDAYRSQSPEVLVPLLEIDGHRLSQSMAIIEYLDETRPEPPLLPDDPLGRAHVRALAQSVACEIHPLNNLRVLKYLSRELKVDEDTKNTWYRHWVRGGAGGIRASTAGAGCLAQRSRAAAVGLLLGRIAHHGGLSPGAPNLQRAAVQCESGRAATHHGCF